jgi:hypothetical protein
MIRYTVVWLTSASDELAEIWLAAADRNAVAAASDKIDAELAEDANRKGVAVHEGLRLLPVIPLRAYYVVRKADRIAEVLKIRRV